jgi:hypothetical protein
VGLVGCRSLHCIPLCCKEWQIAHANRDIIHTGYKNAVHGVLLCRGLAAITTAWMIITKQYGSSGTHIACCILVGV